MPENSVTVTVTEDDKDAEIKRLESLGCRVLSIAPIRNESDNVTLGYRLTVAKAMQKMQRAGMQFID
jgi:hypothetical protein